MGERSAFYENAQRLRDGATLVYTRPGRKKSTYHRCEIIETRYDSCRLKKRNQPRPVRRREAK